MSGSSANRRAVVKAVVVAALLPASAPLASSASQACEPAHIHDILAAYTAAWRRGDTAALVGAYHDDFTLHYPGRHALAGIHRGKAEALRVLQEVARRTRRELISVIDILVGAREGALHVTERWSNEAGPFIVERLFAYTLRDGRLLECRLFDADPTVVEAFLGSSG